MTLLAIDPGRGEKATIGWCVFNDDGTEAQRGEMDWQGLVENFAPWMDDGFPKIEFRGEYREDGTAWFWSITTVVIEDFVNDPRVKRGGQHNGASEVIGAVEFACAQAGIRFVRQNRSELPVAKLQAKYVDTHAHLPHKDSAFLHGFHYLVGQGVVKSVGIDDTM